MSVCNIWIDDDRVMMLTDTVQYADGKAVGLCERKADVADGGFIVAARGQSDNCRLATMFLRRFASLDDALDGFYGFTDLLHIGSMDFEAFIGGFPDDGASPAVFHFNWEHRGRGDFELVKDGERLARGLHLHPSQGIALPAVPRMTEAVMVKLALAQHAAKRFAEDKGFPGVCVGGLMHLTTITRDDAEQRIVGAYPDYESLADRFGCPNRAAWDAISRGAA